MLATVIGLLVVAIMMAIFGPRPFLTGLGCVLFATLCVIGKTLKFTFELLDVLGVIIDILSLFS